MFFMCHKHKEMSSNLRWILPKTSYEKPRKKQYKNNNGNNNNLEIISENHVQNTVRP